MRKTFIDSFSGSAADIPKPHLTEESVLSALSRDPAVSTFAMSQNQKLATIIDRLKKSGRIKSVESEYPWHRWELMKESSL